MKKILLSILTLVLLNSMILANATLDSTNKNDILNNNVEFIEINKYNIQESIFTANFNNNSPPSTPTTPNGPTNGETWVYYLYQTSAIDPDGDSIRYGWDCCNDSVVDFWTQFYPSGATCNVYFRFLDPGVYDLSVVAMDNHGAMSNFSGILTVTIIEGNDEPNKPFTPVGPSNGVVFETYAFSTKTTDPDNDLISYGWDWDGDLEIDEYTGFLQSGETCQSTHMYDQPGTYNIRVMAVDLDGAESEFSNPLNIVITEENQPPNKPTRPSGPTSGKIGVSLSYESTAIDPDGDQIYYQFDWDDGNISEWQGPYNSGDTIAMSHIWDKQGSYQIKVRAKDIHDQTSTWSEPLAITLPKNKIIDNNLFERILLRFPILQLLI